MRGLGNPMKQSKRVKESKQIPHSIDTVTHTMSEEPSCIEKWLSSPFFEKIVDHKKQIGYGVAAFLGICVFLLYFSSRRQEKNLQDMALARLYVQELTTQQKIAAEESSFDAKERKAKYERAMYGLQKLVASEASIEARYGGVLLQALLLQSAETLQKPLVADVIHKLYQAGLAEYGEFSEIAVCSHEKDYSQAKQRLETVVQQLKQKKDQKHGLLLAFSMLQQAALAKEEGNSDYAAAVVGELKELITRAGPDGIIACNDAEQFMKLMHDKNASLLDWLNK